MEEILQKYHLKNKKIAVGVSGGADSLALVLMAAEELKPLGYEIVALTVDHGLRPSSADEATYVAKIMAAHHIEHHILQWQGEKPQSDIEATARIARFELIGEWCEKNDVHCLMLAHHNRDQAETFLMRLQRGSGLQGLCAMREMAEWHGLQILRPLLGRSPEDMQNYLRRKKIAWIEDESNEDERFLRNKIRHFLSELAQKTAITVDNICQTITRLQSAENYIEDQLAQFLSTEIINENGEIFHLNYENFTKLHPEMQFRILAHLLGNEYIPRAESVLHLRQQLSEPNFISATLGGKEILLYNEQIWIVPEFSVKHQTYRAAWKEFIAQHPQYKRRKLPTKVKFALIRTGRKNDLQ